mgnify:CR=1 FL=1
MIALAQPSDLSDIKNIADLCRYELGFTSVSVLEQAILRNEVIVARAGNNIAGFVYFRITRRGYCTIASIAVHPEHRGRGIGTAMLHHVARISKSVGVDRLRLKCPAGLLANKFYARRGFRQVDIEPGKKRPLVIWERNIDDPIFFLSLTHHQINSLIQAWNASGEYRNPFTHIIVSPLFARPGTLHLIRKIKDDGATVIFDSGGYQVQVGKIRYEDLVTRLLSIYKDNTWADWYVLPDYPPLSTDTDMAIQEKVRLTLNGATQFIDHMPEWFQAKSVGVIHGRTEEQVLLCLEEYKKKGVRYVGFGSFETTGPKGSINRISPRTLSALRYISDQRDIYLHLFGIGGPGSIKRLGSAGIIPTSFDSVGWWKAAAYGNIFFPRIPQIHITAIPESLAIAIIHKEKERTGHKCAFCADVKALYRSKEHRTLHNLAVMMDNQNWNPSSHQIRLF